MVDLGLTHIALPVADVERSIAFYRVYAAMEVIHRWVDQATGAKVAWLSDHTRPFAIVLIEQGSVQPLLTPLAHLGVGCKSREAVNTLCNMARQEGCLLQDPQNSGYPVGYWAFLRDPDGHTLELSYGQEIGLVAENS